MLPACRSGWRSVNIPFAGQNLIDALVRRYSTLDEIEMRCARGMMSRQIHQLLSTSPHFIKVVTLAADQTFSAEKTHISAHDFIDLDPISNILNPWPCASTLKVFRARISGIPRPGITRLAEERYPRQRYDLQDRVYERLARFTQL